MADPIKPPRGTCFGMSPAIFHELAWTSTGANTGKRARRFDDAVSICEVCPVRAECLAYALTLTHVEGVFAGYDPNQIKRMRKAARR